MMALIIFLTCVLVALGTGVLAGYSDFKGMTIPNIYSVIIIAAFAAAFGVLWFFGSAYPVFANPLSHLLSAVIVLGLTAVMFFMGGLGAADSKLGTAFALWVGVKGLFPFLFTMALVGGLLGVCALIMQKKKPFKNPPVNSWIDQVQKGASKVPYGIAIAVGAIAAFFDLGYMNLDTFSHLLTD